MLKITPAAYVKMVLLNTTCDCGHTIDSYVYHCRKKQTRLDYTTEDCLLCETVFKIEEI